MTRQSNIKLKIGKSFGEIKRQIHYEYLIYEPKNITGKIPVLIYLAGAGDRGSNIDEMQGTLPIQILEGHFGDLPFFVLVPQCPNDTIWDASGIKLLIDSFLSENLAADDKRVYAIGHSMGARGLYSFMSDYPEVLAAAVPIAGYGCYLTAKKMVNTPMIIFHGKNDKVVPPSETYKMVEGIREAGGSKVKSIVSKDDHGSILMRSLYNEFMYEWLLKQSRG